MTEDHETEEEREEERVESRRPLAAVQTFEVVRRTGLEELERPAGSLFLSGLAAGLAIGFSVVGRAAIESRLPAHAPWAPLIGSAGYALGFILVVIGRFQLFTEQTVTPVMPICRAPTAAAFVALARLWSLVLAANLLGATIFAAAIAFTGMLTPPLLEGVVALGRHELEGGFGPTLAGGVGAGFLVAMMVWLIANLRAGDLAAVFLITWLIGAAGFAHVVAGSVEMAVLVLLGHAGAGEVLAGYLLPALLGNMFGGTALFALIAYGQVMQELD